MGQRGAVEASSLPTSRLDRPIFGDDPGSRLNQIGL
jgi:hypothetical protein